MHCELWFVAKAPVEGDNAGDSIAKEEIDDDRVPDVCEFGVPGALAVAICGFGDNFEDRHKDIDVDVHKDGEAAYVVPFLTATGHDGVPFTWTESALWLSIFECCEEGGAGVFVRGNVFDIEQEEGCKGECFI